MNTLPLVIADHRTPGEPMASLPVKIPAEALERLQAHAARLRCNRTALARDILMRWLEAEEQATSA